ncbi:YqcC family protein [Pseudoalteromonas mariniglutinosa]|uniref:YqcC family protein n=1 Tax=Pseudoalteromonas mariniglutinosa TaxID=206042 RepID=UPI00384D7CB4
MYQQTAVYLKQLISLLQSHNLWQQQNIDSSALQSSVPFCHDTMRFEQWLQFVFIEKMQFLINHKQPLPSNFAVAPMAEMMLAEHAGGQEITALLHQLDLLLSEHHD